MIRVEIDDVSVKSPRVNQDNTIDRRGFKRCFAPFPMKVVSSIKSAKKRHPACQVVRRKGRIYVINKVEPRYKARQG